MAKKSFKNAAKVFILFLIFLETLENPLMPKTWGQHIFVSKKTLKVACCIIFSQIFTINESYDLSLPDLFQLVVVRMLSKPTFLLQGD